ncbi:MAG: hypothetical protein WBA46_04140 [Thermomicrobiales bacterium]
MKRLVSVVASIVVLSFLVSQALAPPVEANQRGPGVDDQLTGWAVLCRMHGGTVIIDTSSRTVGGLPWGRVECYGGTLGGLVCYIDRDPRENSCYIMGHAPGTARPLVSTVSTSNAVLQPLTPAEPVVAPAQVAWVTTEMEGQGVMLAAINACTVLDGTAETGQLSPSDPTSFATHCSGGTLDGHWCQASTIIIACVMESTSSPLGVEPMPAVGAPVAPDAQPVATMAPPTSTPSAEPSVPPTPTTEPTVAPTATVVEVTPTPEPVQPTAEPTTPVTEVTPTPEPPLL